MATTIRELNANPRGSDEPTRTATRPHRSNVAADADQNKGSVEHDESSSEILAYQPTEESCWGEGFEKARDVLFNRVRRLRYHQSEEEQFAASAHFLVA